MASEYTQPPRERISGRNEYVPSSCEENQVYSVIGISPSPREMPALSAEIYAGTPSTPEIATASRPELTEEGRSV